MNPGPALHIRRMRVRLPAASQEDGRTLAQRLSEQLGSLATGTDGKHIGAMRLRVAGDAARAPAALSGSIATAISAKLARHQPHSHA